MKKFIIKLCSFFILVAAVTFLLQGLISLRIKGKTVRGHDNLEQMADVNADLLFTGSSRCFAHFDPSFFDTTFNLKTVNIGVDGHPQISMAIVRLQDYLSRNKPPKFVIFSFDPFSAPNTFHKSKNNVHKNDFARYAFFPSGKDLPMVNYFHFNFWEKYVPLYAMFKYKLLGDAIFLNNIDNSVKYGYGRHDESWDTVAIPVTDTLKAKMFKKSETKEITYSLDSLKKMCLTKNIKLLCIQTPVYKSIYDESIFSETKKICHSLNIPFIDANKEYIRNNINYFYNSNHMNKQGVDELNRLLKDDPVLLDFLSK